MSPVATRGAAGGGASAPPPATPSSTPENYTITADTSPTPNEPSSLLVHSCYSHPFEASRDLRHSLYWRSRRLLPTGRHRGHLPGHRSPPGAQRRRGANGRSQQVGPAAPYNFAGLNEIQGGDQPLANQLIATMPELGSLDGKLVASLAGLAPVAANPVMKRQKL